MGGYIKLDKDLSDDPRLLELAERISRICPIAIAAGADVPGAGTTLPPELARDAWRDASLGALMRLWRYADVYILADNSVTLTVTTASQVMGLPAWIIRMFPAEWLRVRADDTIELPGYVQKNGLIPRDLRRANAIDAREKHRLRSARWRDRKRARRDAPRDASRERHSRVTGQRVTQTPVPGPGPIPYRDRHSAAPGASADRETHTAPRGELASGKGRLARRDMPEATKRTSPSEAELRGKVRKLEEDGLSAHDIVGMLRQYHVTLEQVTVWLKNGAARPPEPPS